MEIESIRNEISEKVENTLNLFFSLKIIQWNTFTWYHVVPLPKFFFFFIKFENGLFSSFSFAFTHLLSISYIIEIKYSMNEFIFRFFSRKIQGWPERLAVISI